MLLVLINLKGINSKKSARDEDHRRVNLHFLGDARKKKKKIIKGWKDLLTRGRPTRLVLGEKKTLGTDKSAISRKRTPISPGSILFPWAL